MITVKRTTADDEDFKYLVVELDKDLAIRDGDEHAFYAQFNKINVIKYAVVIYDESDSAIACGAIKFFADGVMEVKRMYLSLENRNKGIASIVLKELEKWASELGCNKCILETGLNQPEAIRLYEKNGYKIIENYGQYANVANSICFQKEV